MKREVISEYWSDDKRLHAIVVSDTSLPNKNYTVEFYKFGKLVRMESYENYSVYFHEDVAENYVLGIKI